MRVRVQALACVLAATMVVRSVAQSPFAAGTNYIGPFISASTYGSTAAIGGAFEHAINEKWGWGIAADYFSYNFFDVGFKHITIAGTGAYHFDVHNEKIDAFAGAAVGYNIVSIEGGGDCNGVSGCHGSGLLIGGFGGARYWLNEKLALTGRVGYGLGYLSVGVDFKM
jgi:hypothetical protein